MVISRDRALAGFLLAALAAVVVGLTEVGRLASGGDGPSLSNPIALAGRGLLIVVALGLPRVPARLPIVAGAAILSLGSVTLLAVPLAGASPIATNIALAAIGIVGSVPLAVGILRLSGTDRRFVATTAVATTLVTFLPFIPLITSAPSSTDGLVAVLAWHLLTSLAASLLFGAALGAFRTGGPARLGWGLLALVAGLDALRMGLVWFFYFIYSNGFLGVGIPAAIVTLVVLGTPFALALTQPDEASAPADHA